MKTAPELIAAFFTRFILGRPSRMRLFLNSPMGNIGARYFIAKGGLEPTPELVHSVKMEMLKPEALAQISHQIENEKNAPRKGTQAPSFELGRLDNTEEKVVLADIFANNHVALVFGSYT